MRSFIFICALVFLGGLSVGCPDSVEDDPSDSWHEAYVSDNCDACPDCCVSDVDMSDVEADIESDPNVGAEGEGIDPSEEADLDADAGLDADSSADTTDQ